MNSLFEQKQPDNYVSFEEMEAAFGTPTQYQHYYEQPASSEGPQYKPSDEFPQNLVDPDGTANEPEELEAKTVVDHEHAMRTGERIARLIDTGIDFTLSNFVARNGESYRADEKDLQDIAEAWGEISEEHNWNIGPEWTLAILYIMVYGPLVKQAIADRRMAELEARVNRLEQQNQNAVNLKPENNGQQEPKPTNSPYHSQPAQTNPEAIE